MSKPSLDLSGFGLEKSVTMTMATPGDAEAVTGVFWDINSYPVPLGFDGSLVRPFMKRYLETYGYIGPLTITAVGVLTDVPFDILRGLYNSGVNLIHVLTDMGIIEYIYPFAELNLPPANLISISKPCYGLAMFFELYNFRQPFSCCDAFQAALRSQEYCLPLPAEETGESPYWDCQVCCRDPPAEGFENFISHLASEEHLELTIERTPRTIERIPRPREYHADPTPPDSNVPEIPFDLPFFTQSSQPCEIDYEAVTSVYWDIKTCPVPRGHNARLVGPTIKRFLGSLGYSGTITITAVGKLADVPIHILRRVYSSGVALVNVPHGSHDIPCIINEFIISKPPPANIMIISNPKSGVPGMLPRTGYNLLFQHSLPKDSGALEDNCSETGEYSWWACLVCCLDPPAQGPFEYFKMHLTCEEHQLNMLAWLPSDIPHGSHPRKNRPFMSIYPPPPSEPPKLYHKAVTSVFWDITKCPIPLGHDARLVGPCIKRFLENLGCSGSLTVTAAGELTDVPNDILRGLYDSGITLVNVPHGTSSIRDLIHRFVRNKPPPANIMIISDPGSVSIQLPGYTLFRPSLDSLLGDSGAVKEYKIGEAGESSCWVCKGPPTFQGFEDFTTHLASRRHQRKMLDWVPQNVRISRRQVTMVGSN